MKITAVKINGIRHLALYSNGKLALLDDYGIVSESIGKLTSYDYEKMRDITQFKEYNFTYDSIIGQESTLLCIGLNYKSHVSEHSGGKVPDTPVVFSKSNNTFTGNECLVEAGSGMKVDYEGELCVMIGRKAQNVEESKALGHVLGYFIGNDVSSRLLQYRTSQFYLGKSFDGFYPNGPYLSVDEIENPQNLKIQTIVNGDLRQDSNTEYMIFGIKTLISYISKFMTLRPGDCISTGTPSGVIMGMPPEKQKWLGKGDKVEIQIDGLGKLRTIFN
jgi:2-keto-4-pentenoate hydratase/2-oxohepta-3-ene-1,7-dioic acid hydratase in catechol pathway